LLRGEVSVLIDVPPSRRKRLATLSAGMAFGELALLDRSPRSADVHADTAIECAFLPLARFDRMGATHPKITVKLVTNLFRAASRMVLRLNHELASMER
jgi:glutaminase